MLQRWREEGKENVFKLHSTPRIAPLYVRVETADTRSVVAVRFSASVTDYLIDTGTGKVLKGKKDSDSLESVIYFVHVGGEWLLHSIEDGSQSLAVATMKNELDASYLLGMAGGASQLAGADAAQHPGPAQAKGGAVRVAEDDEAGREKRDVAQR
jgi:hypothetical protein